MQINPQSQAIAAETPAFPYPYSMRVSLRARHVNVRILPNKTLVLTIPHRVSQAKAIEFLHQKIDWIAKHIGSVQPLPLDLSPPSSIYLPVFETTWQICYEVTLGQRANLIERPDNYLIYCGPQDDAQKLKKLQHWLQHKAASYLSERICLLSQQCQLNFNELSFRTQRTLWGSCNRAKKISLNYKLIFLPTRLIDYVLIHELAHLRHLNHSSKFWDLVAQFYPEHKQAKRELRAIERDIPAWFYGS